MDAARRLDVLTNEYNSLSLDLRTFIHIHIGPATLARCRELRQRVLDFIQTAEQQRDVFPAPDLERMRRSTREMVQALDDHENALKDPPRIPHPVIAHHELTEGRPRVVIDPSFLTEASTLAEPSTIAALVGCSARTVRRRQLEAGLVQPGPSVLITQPHPVTAEPERLHNDASTGRMPRSEISDADLDTAVASIIQRFENHGRLMLKGQLRAAGIYVSRERVRDAWVRVTGLPAQFGRQVIQRREYRVAGPDSLWHHDGQHGLIHWKIVIHAFIDGHSRFVLGLRASNNNRAETVAHLFSEIVGVYGFPSRMRGDHGVENLIVAELMEHFRGLGRGSYIWGKSVHNVRIERLWVDVVKGFVSKWKAFFQSLEINHRLRRNDRAHIALVHLLFLPCINGDAVAWMEGWNSHTFSRLPNHPRRTHLPSPRELYTLGHVEHGVRATEAVPADDIPEHELAEYGIDWEEHQDDEVMRLHWQNNNLPDVPDADRHPNGWARPPRPETLVDVRVVPPGDILSPQQVDQLYAYLVSLGLDLESTSMDVRRLWWIHALDFCERLP